MKIEIKHRFSPEVLYSHEQEDNSIKVTILESINDGANLRYANLSGAYLRDADIYQVVGTGSSGRCTSYLPKNDKIICGCFYGSLAEFKNKVKDVHSGNKYEKQYLAAILFFETIAERYNQ